MPVPEGSKSQGELLFICQVMLEQLEEITFPPGEIDGMPQPRSDPASWLILGDFLKVVHALQAAGVRLLGPVSLLLCRALGRSRGQRLNLLCV